jgi:hypothetical protein
MPLGQRDNRVESGLLKAGGVKQRQVQARSDLPGQNVARAAHQLAGPFEALGRQHVGDRVRDDCRPDRVSNLPGAGLGLLAVAVHRVVAARAGKLPRRLPKNDVNTRVGWPDEGSEQFRSRIHPTPVRGWKQVDLDCALRRGMAFGFHPDTQLGPSRGCDPSEESGIQLQIETADVMDRLVGNALDAPNAGIHKSRLGAEVN